MAVGETITSLVLPLPAESWLPPMVGGKRSDSLKGPDTEWRPYGTGHEEQDEAYAFPHEESEEDGSRAAIGRALLTLRRAGQGAGAPSQ